MSHPYDAFFHAALSAGGVPVRVAAMNQVIRRVLLGCLMQCCTAALEGQAEGSVGAGPDRNVPGALEQVGFDAGTAAASDAGLPIRENAR